MFDCGCHDNDTSDALNMAFFVHSPSKPTTTQKNNGAFKNLFPTLLHCLQESLLTGSLVVFNSRILIFLSFIEPSHIALVFFLFNQPERVPTTSTDCRYGFRDSELLVIIVVSSANWEILTSCWFGRSMPLQLGS